MINHRKIICSIFRTVLFCCSIWGYLWCSSLYSGTRYISAVYASNNARSVHAVQGEPHAHVKSSVKGLILSNTQDSSETGAEAQQDCRYEVWRSTDAYFMPGDSGAVQISSERNTSVIFLDPDSAVGNVDLNYFYVMETVCDEIITETKRLGEFDYALQETGTTDFNWIGLPLKLEGVHNAADLVNHIQQNSSRGLKVVAIEHWNNVSQSFDSYLPQYPLFSSEIPIVLGYAYRVTVDIDDRENGEAIWTLIGDVPPATAFDAPLRATGTTDFNWVTLPLDHPMLLSSLDVYNALQDSGQDSGLAFDVAAIESWNQTSQSYDTFIPSQPDLSHDFITQPGHVYRISLDMNPGTIIWR